MEPLKVYEPPRGPWRDADEPEKEAWAAITAEAPLTDFTVLWSAYPYVRNNRGGLDRWRGVGHKPGDDPARVVGGEVTIGEYCPHCNAFTTGLKCGICRRER